MVKFKSWHVLNAAVFFAFQPHFAGYSAAEIRAVFCFIDTRPVILDIPDETLPCRQVFPAADAIPVFFAEIRSGPVACRIIPDGIKEPAGQDQG